MVDYFALGLPVVGTRTAALASVRHLIVEAETAEGFLTAMEQGAALRRDKEYVAAVRQEAERRSWGRRMVELHTLLARWLGVRASGLPVRGRSESQSH